jgi:hypothetical protein
MKRSNCNIQSFVLIIFTISLFSCSGNLSRSTAEKQIREKLHIPGPELEKINLGLENEHFTVEIYTKLESEGLMLCNKFAFGVGNIHDSELTEKGKEYAVGSIQHDNLWGNDYIQVRIADLDFGEITGIVEHKGSNISEVKFTLVRKNITPFGKAFNLSKGYIASTATFTKYDDGWRIEK